MTIDTEKYDLPGGRRERVQFLTREELEPGSRRAGEYTCIYRAAGTVFDIL